MSSVSKGPNGANASPPTIYDVALAAGVAASTVSRAFSRPGRVKTETANHIFAVAERLGYRTNTLARALPTGSTKLLGLVLSDLNNPFFARIIRGAQEAAVGAGYTLVVTDTFDPAISERESLERLLPVLDGVLLCTSKLSDSSVRVMATHRPAIVLNRAVNTVPSVLPDNHGGIRQALEHLVALGHRSVAYLAGPERSWADSARWRALLDCAGEFGCRAVRIGPCEPTVEGGRAGVSALLDQGSRAVITFNDLMALGVIRECAGRGVPVPDALSVIGVDDSLAVDDATPSLTTVASPLWDMGYFAMTKLLRRISHQEQGESRPTLLPMSLMVRESCSAPLLIG